MFAGVLYLFKLFWKYEKAALFFMACSCFLSGVLPLASIIIPKYILDELMSVQRIPYLAALVSILLACILFGNTLVNFFNTKYFIHRLICAQKSCRSMFYNLYEADIENVEASSFMDLFKRALTFLVAENGFGSVLQRFSVLISQVITLAGIISIIAVLNPFIVLIFIVIVLITTWFNSKVKKMNNQYQLASAEIDRREGYVESFFYEHRFAKEIRVNVLGKWFEKELVSNAAKLLGFYKKGEHNKLKSQVFSNIASFIQQGIAYGYLIYSVILKRFGIGSFTMFLAAINQFSSAMFALMDNAVDIRRFTDYYEAVEELMNIPKKQREGKRLPVKLNGPPVFEFKNVSFKYANQNSYALRNINLVIAAGQKISIIGENGAGKTTFTKLLMRLYRPTEGQIFLNGVDIQDYDFEDYVTLFSTVFQDFALYSMSLRDNVANGKELDDQIIKDALVKSGLKEKLDSLEKGIDTWVYRDFDETGFEPSGGEGQKIALARALLKDAPVVILDEPTAALDPRAEYEIYMNFNKMVEGKTAIFISHRLSSSQFCDEILVFKNGAIVEQGTHESLMNQQGLYNELFTMQAQFYNGEANR
jgi:ATP-binding cassette subfamily B protein/ATP-binding cassette subfamily C protein